jgi:hypothetical protein
MRAVFVVIPDVFREQALQMAFIHRNDVIEQISSAAFNPTLRNSILPGTFKGGPHGTDLQSTDCHRNFQPILPISVKDHELGSQPKRKRLRQLLNHARLAGCRGARFSMTSCRRLRNGVSAPNQRKNRLHDSELYQNHGWTRQ